MKFPNLAWAAAADGLAHYQMAAGAGMSESDFSRCLNGRAEFSGAEREKLAAILGYPEAWLFQEVVPPARLQRSVNRVVGEEFQPSA
jgi:hypothetical protein